MDLQSSISQVFDQVMHHDYLFKLPAPQGDGVSNQDVGLNSRPLGYTDFPACEPGSPATSLCRWGRETRSSSCLMSCTERNIHNNRTVNLWAMATLAMPWRLFIDRRMYCRCQLASWCWALLAASTQ